MDGGVLHDFPADALAQAQIILPDTVRSGRRPIAGLVPEERPEHTADKLFLDFVTDLKRWP